MPGSPKTQNRQKPPTQIWGFFGKSKSSIWGFFGFFLKSPKKLGFFLGVFLRFGGFFGGFSGGFLEARKPPQNPQIHQIWKDLVQDFSKFDGFEFFLAKILPNLMDLGFFWVFFGGFQKVIGVFFGFFWVFFESNTQNRPELWVFGDPVGCPINTRQTTVHITLCCSSSTRKKISFHN